VEEGGLSHGQARLDLREGRTNATMRAEEMLGVSQWHSIAQPTKLKRDGPMLQCGPVRCWASASCPGQSPR
jgi:hypothetical protein